MSWSNVTNNFWKSRIFVVCKICFFAQTYGFLTFPYIFPALAGAACCARASSYMEGICFVERFCRRVIPSPGWLAEVVAEIVLGFSGCSTSNFSKSVNLFCPTLCFFACFSCMWLSIGGVISPNKCVTPEFSMNKLRCHGVTWRTFFSKKIAFVLDVKSRIFCSDL